jgi:hypothetical protein
MGSSLHTHSPDMNGGQSVVLSFGSDRQVLLWTSGSSHVSKRSVRIKLLLKLLGASVERVWPTTLVPAHHVETGPPLQAPGEGLIPRRAENGGGRVPRWKLTKMDGVGGQGM